MNILQITPGAGGMYCGACFRDNALVGAFRRMGHSATLLPLYLPLILDEPDESRGLPIFFGGINVYLEQKSALFRHLPRWLTQWLDSPKLLEWSGKFASRTRPENVGDLTVSMLKGESGNQARELDQLLAWLRDQPKPDVINLSNVLLIGLVRRLHEELKTPVMATLQGEDTFLDALPPKNREVAWQVLSERAQEVDRFIAPSRYFGELMQGRMGFDQAKLSVVPNGISLAGYEARVAPEDPPVLGFFARMCEDKGLDTLIESFILLKQRETTKTLRLMVGGGLGARDQPLVDKIKEQLRQLNLLDAVEFCPNLSREEKIAFFRRLTVFSTPALYGEAFGLYVIEALAAGVPVVQPRHAAFPEIIEGTQGGILCEPGDPGVLADGIEALLKDSERARVMGERGRQAVLKHYSVDAMATRIVEVYEKLT
ncbi:MAG: Glycogen synthase [Verrucomicrobia subdivision 3 bacterium]|nr:Glycogen synthase [Limisphaerales bacterium]MCS1416327.1 Glycogen synthase [Limisphaerales bacterium]